MLKKIIVLLFLVSLTSCSSIHSTFIRPEMPGQKVFAGTTTNINWVSAAPRNEFYPYSVMGVVDFIPSAVLDLLLLPYTLYDKYGQNGL